MTQEEIVDLIKHTIKRLMEIHLARSNNGQPVDHIFARVDEEKSAPGINTLKKTTEKDRQERQ